MNRVKFISSEVYQCAELLPCFLSYLSLPLFQPSSLNLLNLGSTRFTSGSDGAPLKVVVASRNEDFNGEISVEIRNIFSDELIQT